MIPGSPQNLEKNAKIDAYSKIIQFEIDESLASYFFDEELPPMDITCDFAKSFTKSCMDKKFQNYVCKNLLSVQEEMKLAEETSLFQTWFKKNSEVLAESSDSEFEFA